MNFNETLTYDQVIERYGKWSAMSINLGNDNYTLMPPKIDYRLRRLIQMAADLTCKPLDQLRVLDLACLEGHYCIEFAKQGATAVGIEIREANLAKAFFAKQSLQLDNLSLYQDDVRNLSREKYGTFDIVICSGILYHLEAIDVIQFVKAIYEVCNRLVLFDTFISLSDRSKVEFENKTYWGLNYTEHDEQATPKQKEQDLWASIDNTSSFWLTQPSLCNLIAHVGFTSFYECHLPVWPDKEKIDRRTYVAIKNKPIKILTSPITDQSPSPDIPEHQPIKFHVAQKQRSPLFKIVKKTFPQPN